jgi:hypothetical protein
MDFSVPAYRLPDNKLYDATNMMYDVDTGRLMTRVGLERSTNEAIEDILVYGKTVVVGGTKYQIVASHTKLYKLVEGAADLFGTGAFGDGVFGDTDPTMESTTLIEIGSLSETSGTAIPQFAEFNDNLYIASGDALQKWDGTTLSNVTQAPNCSTIVAKSGRLFINDLDEPDTVRASGILDDTVWSYPGGAIFQAGWTDGDGVEALFTIGDDLLVVKGPYRRSVNVLKGTYPDWRFFEIARGTGVTGKHAISKVGPIVFGLDYDGLNSTQSVSDYGDFKSDPVGGPVVGPLTRELNDTGFLVSWPERAIVLAFPTNDLSVAYALHYSTSELNPSIRWTKFAFQVPRISFAWWDAEAERMYLCSKGGQLYHMEVEDVPQSNNFDDDGADIPQSIRTKVIDPRGTDILLKRATFTYEPLSSGEGEFQAWKDDGNTPSVKTSFTVTPTGIGSEEAETLFIGEADSPFLGTPEPPVVVRIRNRSRGLNLQLGINVTSGAIAISRMDLDASVLGRE